MPALRPRRAGYRVLPELRRRRPGGFADFAHEAALARRMRRSPGRDTRCPTVPYEAVPVRNTTHTRVLTTVGAGVAVAVGGGCTASVLATPVVPRYVCPPDCGQPPIGKPVETNPWFMSSDGRFSVQYPRAGTAYEVTLEPDGVEVNFTAGDTGTMQFFGVPAQGRTSKQIAEELDQ